MTGTEAVNGRRARRARGSLTRAQVVDAALALADKEGLAGLTMPALAQRLECGVMTIYGYVEDKAELLDAVAQRGLEDLRFPRPMPADVAGILEAWGRTLRTTLLEHPSLPGIFLGQPVVGPGIFRGVEWLLRTLEAAGCPPGRGLSAIYAVLIYTVGFVGWEIPRVRRQPQERYAASWRQVFAGLRASDFPRAATVLDEFGSVASDGQFETGLTGLASGLAAALKS